MSLTRSAIVELCGYVQEKSSALFGNKFWDCRTVSGVECGTKPDKLEARILAVSKFRVFILHGKTAASLKVDRFFHLLSIRTIQILNDLELCICLDESSVGKRRLFVRTEVSARDLAIHLLTALKHYFPDCSDCLKSMIELTPGELYADFSVLPCSRPSLACNNFRRSYAALCDFYDQPFREEVVWDVEKIYASHRLRTLRLDDFTHLLPRDLVPILAVCQFSSYFTGICVDGVRLSADLVDVILAVVRRSQWLTSLALENCSLPRDFMSLFAGALQSNVTIPLEVVDLSKNALDDKKGFVALNAVLSRISRLRSLRLSECLISEKCVNLVAAGLFQGLKPNSSTQHLQLVSIDFSGNSLKDDVNDLLHLFSLCASLRSINLSDTGFCIDKLWAPLKFGGLQLETIKLAGCQASRRSKDGVQNMKEYFSTAVALRHIDFSNTILCGELLKALLLGLASNQQLKPFELVLDGICDRSSASVLETCLGSVDACSLSLRDNGLEGDVLPVVSACSHMPHLRRLDLSGGNFSTLRRSAKHANTLTSALLELVKLVGEEDSQLNELVLSDCRLGSHLSVLLNTLGVASSLQLLDITGNEMGNFGARLLAKALQINVSLKTVLIDRNQITGDGFADIAHALKLNCTLLCLPYPIVDVADSLNRPDRAKTLAALTEIESSLEKNRLGRRHGQTHFRSVITSLQQELFGRCDSVERLGEFCESLNQKLSAMLSSESLCSPFENAIEGALVGLEELAVNAAKESLEPVMLLAESEGYECRPPAFDKSSSARTAIFNALSDYLSDLKWAEVGGTAECLLTEFRSQSSADDRRSVGSSRAASHGSPQNATHSTSSRSALKSHRPKSVITDLTGIDGLEDKLSFDVPPAPSALNHVSKSRPRPLRNVKKVQKRSPSMEESMESSGGGAMFASSDFESNSAVYDVAADEEASSHCSEPHESPSESASPVAAPRAALLPPPQPAAAPLSPQLPQLSPSVLSAVPPSAPPLVPRRNRVGPALTPPSLPPKPDAVTVRPVSCAVEDENANSRRSVADMARMFSSSETPFLRRC